MQNWNLHSNGFQAPGRSLNEAKEKQDILMSCGSRGRITINVSLNCGKVFKRVVNLGFGSHKNHEVMIFHQACKTRF